MSVKVITEQVLGSSDIYCHLSIPADPLSAPKSSSVTLFVSNCAQAQGCPMGSLVYSIPTVSCNRYCRNICFPFPDFLLFFLICPTSSMIIVIFPQSHESNYKSRERKKTQWFPQACSPKTQLLSLLHDFHWFWLKNVADLFSLALLFMEIV